ncbi:hypothetical protein [Halorarius litoreus]|uniref:hypothetical protein n=1 Tax=Halorarius litoreus TaxID=2962676 RepID=UPI0020CF088D|nr:hypothetical protein [Halorarius litoreus]
MYRPNLTAWVPRYGTVRSFVLVALLAIVVWRAEAPLRETVATALSVGESTAWTGTLVALSLLAVVVFAVEYRRQTRRTPAFFTPDVRAKFYEQRVPPRALFAAYVLLLVAGSYVALFAREVFFTRLDNALLVVRRLVTTGDPGAFSLSALGYGVLFVVGALAFAHATDRVLVAGWRKLIATQD